jgi:hypothetical protein
MKVEGAKLSTFNLQPSTFDLFAVVAPARVGGGIDRPRVTRTQHARFRTSKRACCVSCERQSLRYSVSWPLELRCGTAAGSCAVMLTLKTQPPSVGLF